MEYPVFIVRISILCSTRQNLHMPFVFVGIGWACFLPLNFIWLKAMLERRFFSIPLPMQFGSVRFGPVQSINSGYFNIFIKMRCNAIYCTDKHLAYVLWSIAYLISSCIPFSSVNAEEKTIFKRKKNWCLTQFNSLWAPFFFYSPNILFSTENF